MSLDELFPNTSREVVCVGCGGPREVSHQIRPGETLYKPCPKCGAQGLMSKNDQYVPHRQKKAKREAYEDSRYRGGKPAPRAK